MRLRGVPEGVEVVGGPAHDGSTRYRYRAYEFTVERRHRWGGMKWGCPEISVPLDPTRWEDTPFEPEGPWEPWSIAHEAGWLSWRHDAVIRKCVRVIDAQIHEDRRERELENVQ